MGRRKAVQPQLLQLPPTPFEKESRRRGAPFEVKMVRDQRIRQDRERHEAIKAEQAVEDAMPPELRMRGILKRL